MILYNVSINSEMKKNNYFHSMKKIKFLFILLLSNSILAQNPARDTTFGNNGNVRTPVGINNEDAISVVVQADDKIIAGGTQTDNPTFGPQRFALVRYQTNGDLDSTFGVNGIVLSSFLSQNWLNVIKLQTDERILAAGQSYINFCIARYNNDGSIDSTFGTNGVTMVPTTISGSVSDLSILANGYIIIAGSNSIPGSNTEMKMMRLTDDGLVDSAFGNNGEVSSLLGFISTSVSSVLVQTDQKIVIGGRGKIDLGGNIVSQMFLARFYETGLIDSSYGINGVASYPMAENVNDMCFDAFGNIIATGEIGTNSLGTAGDISVMRITSAGIPDSSFGTDGSNVISVDSYADYVNALVLQPDGKILVGGSYFNFGGGSGTDCLVIRFLDDGTPDTTFGVNGVFKTGVSSGTDRILDMALDSRNRIIYSGAANYSVNFDFIVGRIITDLLTTNLDILSRDSGILIYPNPSSGLLNINCVQAKVYFTDIFNLSGQLVYSDRNYAHGNFNIDVSGLEAGIYFLRLFNEESSVILKFVIVD